jgi:gas vesicle protein
MPRVNKFMAGLVMGAAVGATAGVLLAPRPGKETRHALRERAGRFGKTAGGRMGKMFNHSPAGASEQPVRGR